MPRLFTVAFVCLAVCTSALLFGQFDLRCDIDQRFAQDWNRAAIALAEERIEVTQHLLQIREPMAVPVVFHVIYREDTQNISDVQIRSQLDILNRDFAFQSDNLYGVPQVFAALGADSGIRFCLASRDPDGNPTSGVTRTFTPVENIGTHRQTDGRYSVHYTQYGGNDGWDETRYVNIWVAGMDGLLGSASFPGMATYPEEDGIVIDPAYVGSVGLAATAEPFDRGHTLTHEIGHYLGLYHIWGQGNGSCGTDDMVEDTPDQERPYLGCPEYPQISCGSSDMFMNFMDFTTDRCLALFTRGQIERMQGVLMGLRQGLIENAMACDTPDSGKPGLDDALVYYAPGTNQIIVVLGHENDFSRRISLYAIDGRLLRDREWQLGRTYWLDADSLPTGIYVVRLESGGDVLSQKVFIAQ